MLERRQVEHAVDVQERSYRLLLWLDKAIEKGFVHFDRAHEYLEAHEAARDWITVHFHNLPRTCRPDMDSLDAFARFFATYVITSFDLVEKPGKRPVTGGCGCYCSFCSYVVAAPHLRPKKLTRRDKAQALALKVRLLLRLAAEEGLVMQEEEAARIASDPEAGSDAALAAYGAELVARMRGEGAGPAVLALWREFAWDPRGGPRKGFHLSAEDVLRAEERLLARVRAEIQGPEE